MTYVDGFVIPIPKKNIKKYQRIASKAGKVWMEYGALQYIECIGDDLDIKGVYPFTKLAKTKPGETVIFSFIIYKSKAHRDSVNAKVMKDERMNAMMKEGEEPFDMKRLTYGGFTAIVDY